MCHVSAEKTDELWHAAPRGVNEAVGVVMKQQHCCQMECHRWLKFMT